MVVPSLALASLAVVIGFLNMPFHNFEFERPVPAPTKFSAAMPRR